MALFSKYWKILLLHHPLMVWLFMLINLEVMKLGNNRKRQGYYCILSGMKKHDIVRK